jgi:hypothetical protein
MPVNSGSIWVRRSLDTILPLWRLTKRSGKQQPLSSTNVHDNTPTQQQPPTLTSSAQAPLGHSTASMASSYSTESYFGHLAQLAASQPPPSIQSQANTGIDTSPSSSSHHLFGSSTNSVVVTGGGPGGASSTSAAVASSCCPGSVRLPLFVEGSERPHQFGVYRTDLSEGRNAFVMSDVERGLDDRTTVMVRCPSNRGCHSHLLLPLVLMPLSLSCF